MTHLDTGEDDHRGYLDNSLEGIKTGRGLFDEYKGENIIDSEPGSLRTKHRQITPGLLDAKVTKKRAAILL